MPHNKRGERVKTHKKNTKKPVTKNNKKPAKKKGY